MSDEINKYAKNKLTDRTYVGKAFNVKDNEGNVIEKRYITKVFDIEDFQEYYKDLKTKKVYKVIRDGQRQEVVAVVEKDSRNFSLRIQRFTKETGMPHCQSFSFHSGALIKLIEFIDSLGFIDFSNKNYFKLDDKNIQEQKDFWLNNINLINKIKGHDPELLSKLFSELTDEDFSALLLKPKNIKNLFSVLPQIRIDILENLKDQLKGKLSENESAIQKWIDEEPKTRCLLFGLEFIDYKREAQFGNSRFDILTEQSGSEHVIIEMKSPNVNVFDEKTVQLKNGVKKEYVLSKDLAEAIPQTIKYFREYEEANDETFQKSGTKRKKPHKALIIIGRKINDPIWQQHFTDLNNRISGIEILTYDHLIEKIENQINNLRELK